MNTIADAKVAHYYNCYNGYFFGCLLLLRYVSLSTVSGSYNKKTRGVFLPLLPYTFKKL